MIYVSTLLVGRLVDALSRFARRPGFSPELAEEVCEALKDANVLVTDLHERAIAACEGAALHWRDNHASLLLSAPGNVVVVVGEESLAARAPKRPKKYSAERRPAAPSSWRVAVDGESAIYRNGQSDWSEAQARAVAAALNEAEGK